VNGIFAVVAVHSSTQLHEHKLSALRYKRKTLVAVQKKENKGMPPFQIEICLRLICFLFNLQKRKVDLVKNMLSNVGVNSVACVSSAVHLILYLPQQQYSLKRWRMCGKPTVHCLPRVLGFFFHGKF
jgi:hypothetical protein